MRIKKEADLQLDAITTMLGTLLARLDTLIAKEEDEDKRLFLGKAFYAISEGRKILLAVREA